MVRYYIVSMPSCELEQHVKYRGAHDESAMGGNNWPSAKWTTRTIQCNSYAFQRVEGRKKFNYTYPTTAAQIKPETPYVYRGRVVTVSERHR